MREISTGTQGFKNLSVFASSAIITAVCLFFSVSGAAAQGSAATSGSSHESERAAQVRTLNNSVLVLHGQMQESPAGAAGNHSQAAIVLAQRAAALQTLIQEDPHAALTFAFSPELLADLAAKFPDSATLLEAHVTLRGPVQHSVADYPNRTSQESWLMNVGNANLNLHFATRERPDLNGGTVTVTGVRAGADIAVSNVGAAPLGGTSAFPKVLNFPKGDRSFALVLSLMAIGILLLATSVKLTARAARLLIPALRQLAACAIALVVLVSSPSPASAQSSCSTTGIQNVAVLLVNFSNVSVSATPATTTNYFFGNDGGVSLSGYWEESSYGQTSATGKVFGPYTIGTSSSYSCSNMLQIFNDTLTASGLNLQGYSRVFIVLPGLGCGWAGFTLTGTAGAGCNTWTAPSGGSLIASLSFLIDSWITQSRYSAVQLTAHEAGHQLGLFHGGTITEEPTAVLGPSSAPGTSKEWNDFFTVMGAIAGNSPPSPLYDAVERAKILGWMALGTNYQTVSNSGTYTLQPLETSPPGLQALRIARGTGNTTEYIWVEYRQPVGAYDSLLNPSYYNFNGASVHYENTAMPDLALGCEQHTCMMDFTPTDIGSWLNTVLAPGQTWTDSSSDLSITVNSATSSGLTVNVGYSGASSCVSSAPTVSVSPLDPSLYAGQSASYTVSITNNDSSACSSSTLNLTSSEPSSWTTTFSSPSVTLSPGQSASVTMGKGAPSGIPVGTYAVNLTASGANSSASGTANATVMAQPSLAVSISTNATTFAPPSTASITASVTSGGTPASGASVTFTLTMPNGSTATQTAAASSSGAATWNYKVNSRALPGTYSVVARASLTSGSTGKKTAATSQGAASNTATFMVQ